MTDPFPPFQPVPGTSNSEKPPVEPRPKRKRKPAAAKKPKRATAKRVVKAPKAPRGVKGVKVELSSVLGVLAGVKAKDKDLLVPMVEALHKVPRASRKRIVQALTGIFG